MNRMSYVVLARKYRPRSFAQMVGQEHVVQALTNALTQQRLHHAYLFTGTRGIGKTTVSRILAKSLNCTGADGQGGITAQPCGVCQACTEIDADRYLDYIELDAASNRSIDEIRDLIERAAYKPGIGRFKVFMIDEAHQLTKDAFNALLKTLEEPPDYLKFVLATTDPDKMLPTVLSRCLQFNLRPMAPATVREHLHKVLTAENVPFDDGSLRLLARAANGSMRDGLSLTDQAIAYGGGRLEQAGVRAMLGSVDRGHAKALVQALAQRDAAATLAQVDGLRALGLSAAATLEEMALLLQQMAVEQMVPGALDTEDPDCEAARELAPLLPADETQFLYSLALHGRAELNLMGDEYAALSMVLLRFLAFPPAGRAGAEAAREPRSAPLRSPAPPAIAVQASVSIAALARVPSPAALPPTAPVPQAAPPQPRVQAEAHAPAFAVLSLAPPPAHAPALKTAMADTAPAAPVVAEPVVASGPSAALGDRWSALVNKLCDGGALNALLREVAWQAGLQGVDDAAVPPQWLLTVEREPLRSPALAEKLSSVLTAELGRPLQVVLQAGIPSDSPAKRDAAERARRQAQAEDTIHNDPVVKSLLAQFKTARVVPGSVKPV
jgi:DNA polymerase-3 subunit gamma/tau